MCGIFGATSHQKFCQLYRLNCGRGDFATGILTIYDTGTHCVVREKGIIDPDFIPTNGKIYLGHVRAPTNGLKEFDNHDSHPFVAGPLILAHNGIIHNDKHLRHKYHVPDYPTTDSFTLLYIIWKEGLVKGLETIDGIFGCWMYDQDNRITLFRSTSSIFIDYNCFSSTSFPGCDMMEQGIVFTFPYFVPVHRFKYDTPYYVPEVMV